MVVCVSPPAAAIGADILKRGGNAVDAAVGVALAMAVTFPEAGNIGGGGFMLVKPAHAARDPVCIDYRETAPDVCRADTFADITEQLGAKTVGVPGTIRGLERAHRQFGTLPWKTLVLPAVALARDGFPLDAGTAAALDGLIEKHGEKFPELARVFQNPAGGKWAAGNVLKQPDLAATLQRLADIGPDEFYAGQTAGLIIAEIRRGEGFLAPTDLRNYRAVLRQPVRGSYRGYDVYSTPPPSSGGTALVTMLNILERYPLKEYGRYDPRTLHLMTEAMRRAYADRARYLGDPLFTTIPEYLTTKEHARTLAETIAVDKATESEKIAPEIKLAGEGESTTHFSVLDAAGMAVANTYTLQNSYGSLVVVAGGGFLLNNEMTDFNWRRETDRTGKIGTPPNLVAPNKRMLSSQSPTIVTRDGKLVLITGSPGGRTIPNTVLNVVLNVLEFDMEPADAIAAPRMHHQWFPDVLRCEGLAGDKTESALKTLGDWKHQCEVGDRRQGDAHSIVIRNGKVTGVADRRRNPDAIAVTPAE